MSDVDLQNRTGLMTSTRDPSPSYRLISKKLMDFKMGVFGGLILLCFVFIAVFCPWLAPHDPLQQNMDEMLLPPAWMESSDPRFWLGTDDQGRDILSTIIFGARISLFVGFASVIFSMIFPSRLYPVSE